MLLLLLSLLTLSTANITGGGLGAQFKWVDWAQAKDVAAKEDKPIMVVLHKTWCGACKNLKPKFAASKELLEMSEKFVMVNSEDDEAPISEADFSIDGGYIPRIVFVDSKGTVRPEFTNKARPAQYKYFYPAPDQILTTMKEVIKSGVSTSKTEL